MTVATFATRVQAAAAAIPGTTESVIVLSWDTGYPSAVAIYVPGTSSGPAAFQDANSQWWELQLGGGPVNVLWFGANPDSSTNNTPAFSAAIQAAYDYSHSGTFSERGTVFVPQGAGMYRIQQHLDMLRGVSLLGEGGQSSCIMADDCDALHYEYDNGFGQAQVSGIFLYGVNASDPRTAILRPSTGTDQAANRMVGFALQNLLVWGFDTAVDVTSVGNLWLTNCFFIYVNYGVKITGFCFGVRFQGFVCYGLPEGDQSADGIVTEGFQYSIPHEFAGPEAIEINQSQIYHFNNAMRFNIGNFVTVTNSDVQAEVNGIRFKDIGSGVYIHNNYIGMDGENVHAGIFGEGSASVGFPKVNIDSNTLIYTAFAMANGIQVNESGQWGQTNVSITKNSLTGFPGRDIYVFGPNQVLVEGNSAASAGALASIEFTAATGGVNLIKGNNAAVSIIANATDISDGAVRLSDNIVNGVRQVSTWGQFTTVSPTSAPAAAAHLDTSGAATVVVSASPGTIGNEAIAVSGQYYGMLIIADVTHGYAAAFLLNGGATVMLNPTNTGWDIPGTMPASGKSSVNFTGGQYNVYNNHGASVTYHVTNIKT
jgi:hypothetical protein